MSETNNTKTVRTVCALRDGAMCGIMAHLKDGRITKVTPADFPDSFDRGCCTTGLATPQWIYHKDRLRYPLKRIGKRGEGKWERVSWEEAMDGIADKLKELIQRYGPSSIVWNADPSAVGNMKWAGYSRVASLTNSTWLDIVGFGDSAGLCGNLATFGALGGRYLVPNKDPKFSFVWGINPANTSWRTMRTIMRDKENGCKLVCIDPRYSRTASRCDEHISIRPGTDGALALAMIHVIIEQGLEDKLFITDHTVGPLLVRDDNGMFLRESDLIKDGKADRFMVFDKAAGKAQPDDMAQIPALSGSYTIDGIACKPAFVLLADMTKLYTPEKASEITDIPAETIQRLAVDYATKKPAAIRLGLGSQRSFYGDLSWRAINTLAALTGNINLNELSRFVLNSPAVMMPGEKYYHLPIMKLDDAITKGDPFPVKALWIASENFINQMPDMNRIVNDLLPCLELIVVVDLAMTVTAKYADYVLPEASFYEYVDLLDSYPVYTPYLQLQQKVIEPLYESKSDFQIAAELGRRMGFSEYFNKTEEQYVEEFLASDHPSMEGVNLEKLKKGPLKAKPTEKIQELKTPTGRIEFYVERLKSFGQQLPVYIEPIESARSEKAKIYPLSFITSHPKYRKSSAMGNVEALTKHDPEPFLYINPKDAEPRKIIDGDVVRVFNDRGKVKLKAKLNPNVKPGVVDIQQGWWPEHYMEGHHNQLTHGIINPAQAAIFQPNAALFDVLVEVKKEQ